MLKGLELIFWTLRMRALFGLLPHGVTPDRAVFGLGEKRATVMRERGRGRKPNDILTLFQTRAKPLRQVT